MFFINRNQLVSNSIIKNKNKEKAMKEFIHTFSIQSHIFKSQLELIKKAYNEDCFYNSKKRDKGQRDGFDSSTVYKTGQLL